MRQSLTPLSNLHKNRLISTVNVIKNYKNHMFAKSLKMPLTFGCQIPPVLHKFGTANRQYC